MSTDVMKQSDHDGERSLAVPLSSDEYDAQWSRLGDFSRFNPGARHRRRLVADALRDLSPSTCLDVGCGAGDLILLLHQTLPNVSLKGVDLSSAVVKENARAMPFAEFDEYNLEFGPLNERFDLVICSEVIEHLADWRRGIRNLASMVSTGGHLLLTCPTGRIHATESHFGHIEHPTPDDLILNAEEAGLVQVQFQNWGFPTYRALKWMTNLRPDWAMKSFAAGSYTSSQRLISSLAYGLTRFSLPDSPFGCQLVGLFSKGDQP